MILYPYQLEIFHAVLDSVWNRLGLTFTVEMARQGGKNETSAHIESAILAWFAAEGGDSIKCAPSFRPQAIISRRRLEDCLDYYGLDRITEDGFVVCVGRARQFFLSAAKSSMVVGHTAGLLLEVDEAQDVSREKYTRDFRPMGSSTNVTTVMWGTTWDDSTLLEQQKQLNLEQQRQDGLRRHFSFDWQAVAALNPAYRAFAEQERHRLGENHPIWLTQFALKTIPGNGRLFSRAQLAQLVGAHPRRQVPLSGQTYVAGLDLAGAAEGNSMPFSVGSPLSPGGRGKGEGDLPPSSTRDSSALVIAEVTYPSSFRPERSPAPASSCHSRSTQCMSGIYPAGSTPVTYPVSARRPDEGSGGGPASSDPPVPSPGPQIRIVENYSFAGISHADLYPRLVHILKNVWSCHRILVDATGVGAGVASFLQQSLGSRVVPFIFTTRTKSDLGYELIAAVNSGRLKLYAPDGSPDYAELVRQLELCRPQYRPNQTLNFFVNPEEGHDDYVMALALAVRAAASAKPRIATGNVF